MKVELTEKEIIGIAYRRYMRAKLARLLVIGAPCFVIALVGSIVSNSWVNKWWAGLFFIPLVAMLFYFYIEDYKAGKEGKSFLAEQKKLES